MRPSNSIWRAPRLGGGREASQGSFAVGQQTVAEAVPGTVGNCHPQAGYETILVGTVLNGRLAKLPGRNELGLVGPVLVPGLGLLQAHRQRLVGQVGTTDSSMNQQCGRDNGQRQDNGRQAGRTRRCLGSRGPAIGRQQAPRDLETKLGMRLRGQRAALGLGIDLSELARMKGDLFGGFVMAFAPGRKQGTQRESRDQRCESRRHQPEGHRNLAARSRECRKDSLGASVCTLRPGKCY